MASLAEITEAWEALGAEELRGIFPDLRCFAIGWGEPFCFRCGWLAPPEAADYPRNWKAARAINYAWNAATGWLERAHLRDHQRGGGEDRLNLVPLCVLCHEQQPVCRTRGAGVAFVNAPPPTNGLPLWLVQVVTDEIGRGIRKPGKQLALRKMLRARAIVGDAYVQAVEQERVAA